MGLLYRSHLNYPPISIGGIKNRFFMSPPPGGAERRRFRMQITRREFSSMLSASALATITKPFPISDSPRWNVLIITNDQHRADCLGCMGNPVIQTPHVDRLAKEGVLFEQHFVQAPQCVPSRSALHTGRYPHVNRTPSNLYRLPETEETLATILGRQGYLT